MCRKCDSRDKKEPLFLCARQEELYSALGRSCKENFQSCHFNPSPSQHSNIYLYRNNSLSDLSGYLELRSEPVLWNKQPQATATGCYARRQTPPVFPCSAANHNPLEIILRSYFTFLISYPASRLAEMKFI